MPHFLIKYAACKLSSAKFSWLYGLWLCHKPVFYAEHRRPVVEGLVLYAPPVFYALHRNRGHPHLKGLLQGATHISKEYALGLVLYGINPGINPPGVDRANNQSSMLCIEDWLIEPTTSLLCSAYLWQSHKPYNQGATQSSMQSIEDWLQQP
jgi:hypothetical protein